MSKEQIIHEALSLQPTAISYHLSQHLATLFPDRALLEGDEELFNIELFLSSTVRWVTRPQQGSMDQVLTSQIDVLREQMTSAATKAAKVESKTKAESK